MACKHGSNAPDNVLSNLPHSQAGEGRHKCASCAYQAGYKAATAHYLRELDNLRAKLGGQTGHHDPFELRPYRPPTDPWG